MATPEETNAAVVEATTASSQIQRITSQEINLSSRSRLYNSSSKIPHKTRQDSQDGLSISIKSDAESRYPILFVGHSDAMEEKQRTISSLHDDLGTPLSSFLISHPTHPFFELISSSADDDIEPISRGRIRNRSGSESSQSESLFHSRSRASSVDTSVTERSESVFSPPQLLNRPWSRSRSPARFDNNFPKPEPIIKKKKRQILKRVDKDTSIENNVPCLQCQNAGLRCSFSTGRPKDRTDCTRCQKNGDSICIALVYIGIDDKGEKIYEFSTDFDKVKANEFETRFKEVQEEKWTRDRFALPKPKPGYRGRLKNWRETSAEKRQRLKDCHFVVK